MSKASEQGFREGDKGRGNISYAADEGCMFRDTKNDSRHSPPSIPPLKPLLARFARSRDMPPSTPPSTLPITPPYNHPNPTNPHLLTSLAQERCLAPQAFLLHPSPITPPPPIPPASAHSSRILLCCPISDKISHFKGFGELAGASMGQRWLEIAWKQVV